MIWDPDEDSETPPSFRLHSRQLQLVANEPLLPRELAMKPWAVQWQWHKWSIWAKRERNSSRAGFFYLLWNVGAEVKSPFVLCCSYDCNIERGLRLFAFHPSVLKGVASLWMCVTDKGARWLFWFEKVCLSALPTSTHFWSQPPKPLKIEESLCVNFPAVQLTRGDLSRGVFIAGTGG